MSVFSSLTRFSQEQLQKRLEWFPSSEEKSVVYEQLLAFGNVAICTDSVEVGKVEVVRLTVIAKAHVVRRPSELRWAALAQGTRISL